MLKPDITEQFVQNVLGLYSFPNPAQTSALAGIMGKGWGLPVNSVKPFNCMNFSDILILFEQNNL